MGTWYVPQHDSQTCRQGSFRRLEYTVDNCINAALTHSFTEVAKLVSDRFNVPVFGLNLSKVAIMWSVATKYAHSLYKHLLIGTNQAHLQSFSMAKKMNGCQGYRDKMKEGGAANNTLANKIATVWPM